MKLLWDLWSFLFYCFLLFLCIDHQGRLSHLSLLFFGTLHSDRYIFPFLLCLSLLFLPQLGVRPPQTAILPFCVSSSWGWFWSPPMGFPHSSVSKESACSAEESESCLVTSNCLRPYGIFQARILEWVSFPFSRGSSQPGFEPRSPTLQADSLPAEPQGMPKNTEVGSLSLLQRIFPTQESNWGLLHCRRILYQLSYQGRTHSSILAWRIPWTVQSMGSQRVGHDWATFTVTFFHFSV